MTSWQSGNPRKALTKSAMLSSVAARGDFEVESAKLAGKNTLRMVSPRGVVRVRLWETDILELQPSSSGFAIDTGGFNTVTTRSRLNQHLPSGWSVYTSRGVAYLRDAEGNATPFISRVRVSGNGAVSSDIASHQLLATLKRLDGFMKAWRKQGLPSDAGGDPWVLPDSSGKYGRDYVESWIADSYCFRRYYFNALKFAGVDDAGASYLLHMADRKGGELDAMALGRIRRFTRANIGLAA